jgi:hypothetical protein
VAERKSRFGNAEAGSGKRKREEEETASTFGRLRRRVAVGDAQRVSPTATLQRDANTTCASTLLEEF